ncbi:MAG: efflux RND transporter periplasmic adaptor subunit, partial [Burkholderiaceae bacterium]
AAASTGPPVDGAAASEAVRTLGCQAALTGAESLDDGLRALLMVLARQHGCTRVAFGWSRRAGARVVALSDSAGGRPAHEVAAPLATAMDEALDQEAAVAWPESNGREMRISVAQAQLARLAQVGAVCSVPLVEHGRALGALTFERAGPAFDPRRIDELTRVAAFVAPLIAQRRRAERPLKTLVERLRARLFGPRRRAGIVVVAIGLALAGAAIVPVPDRVSGAARVEGATQRTLTAPADGWLLRVHVRPGDAVRADQVLVELDDRELSMERLRWATEADQAERQATEALARDDRAQFAVQAARGAQAKAQRGLIDAQLERQKVRAPFDGIVLSGDLTQSLGAPVRAGDTLLAVAPAGRHRVIVDVDERDIACVASDATGELALTAHAGRKVAIVVTRISPAAVARDGATVFEVEAAPRAEAELRPGYQGVAKFDADRRSVLAVLLERPWRALADRVWAWGW